MYWIVACCLFIGRRLSASSIAGVAFLFLWRRGEGGRSLSSEPCFVESVFGPNLIERIGCAGVLILFAIILIRIRVFERRLLVALESIYVSFTLADRGLLSVYRRMARAVTEIGAQSDPLAREVARSA